jgi:hypothetical protein
MSACGDCDDDKQPICLALECEPCDGPPIGYTSETEFTTLYPWFNPKQTLKATGKGWGSSTLSQADADQQALDMATEHANRILRFKIRVISAVAKILGMRFRPIVKSKKILVNESMIAPLFAGWRGRLPKKPQDYRVTAAIPHLETIQPLKMCIEVLRAQTERPYIMIIDTGSSHETCAELEMLRAEDVEIHYLKAHGYMHASEPVTAALDTAQALCRTEILFHTHADCFLRRFDFLEKYSSICSNDCPVIGYRMSPREWATDEWQWMVGHTATLLHMPTIHRLGATWSMQRMHEQFGYPWTSGCGGWPDTETGFNNILREAGVTPYFIGDDENGKRQIDENIDHVRSYAGSYIYSRDNYHVKAAPWMVDALKDARGRLDAMALVNEI